MEKRDQCETCCNRTSSFNSTKIWCSPAVQISNKWEHKLKCNVIGGVVHKVLSCSWSTVIQTSITTNNIPIPPNPLSPCQSDIAIYLHIISTKGPTGKITRLLLVIWNSLQGKAYSYSVTETNLTYRRTTVPCKILYWMIEAAVSVQTEQSDTKRQVTGNLVH
jgi:hypothetical protein